MGTNTIIQIEELIEEFHIKNINDCSNEFITKLTSIVEEKNSLILKTINELSGYRFFVDNYQRGYKWKEEQVENLLDDIHEFDEKENAFYSLQPVVVKHHRNSKTKKSYWELIDGQQRITTIYMILTYLKYDKKYHIDYETRESSARFLTESLSTIEPDQKWVDFISNDIKSDNVDNYHFFVAYKTISNWFDNKFKQDASEINKWLDKLLNITKVIWYVAKHANEESSSIDIFLRLNSGKIPLTNAELIKALFLHNVSDSDSIEVYKMKQNQIAHEWDVIEHALQEDDFWYFLQPKSKNIVATRIEIIFDLIRKTSNHNLSDNFASFLYFQKKLKGCSHSDLPKKVELLWKEIKEVYYLLYEWYHDDYLYHRIGFLITRDMQHLDELWKVVKDTSRCKDKGKFREHLNNLISQKIKTYFTNEEIFSIDNLQYGSNDNPKIVNILILFNIYVHENIKSRFPFEQYAKVYEDDSWSLEHIHAQSSKNADGTQKEEIEGMHSITNLALLQTSLNSSLGNADFKNKRKKIMEWEKEGKFLPLATKNIFAKYYSENVDNMNKWGKTDRKSYEEVFNTCLEKFLIIAKDKKS